MGKKILLVDGDQQFTKLVSSVLEGRGHNVTSTHVAVPPADLQAGDLDLIILSSPMPDSDDLEWLTRLRNEGFGTKVILIAKSQDHLHTLKPRVPKDLAVSLMVHKPLIPYIFGAQVDRQLDPDQSEAANQKMKDFETMFLALVTKYARVLPTRIAELSQAMEKAKENPRDADLTGEVRGLAHKIKGTGGSLGFRQVSECMGFIENAAAEMPNMTQEEQQFSWAELDRKLVEAQLAGELECQEINQAIASADLKVEKTPHNPAMTRILVVDEDRQFLDIVCALGKQRLVDIVRATNHKEAIEQAVVYPLDAALINVLPQDPEQSFRLARSIRELPGYENLPLAFISGQALVKDRVEAAHAGASLYLDKPLESDSLEKAVQHLVNIRQGGRPRILVCDDDEFFANTVALVLRNEGMIVRTLNDPSKILETMQEYPPELMLLDVMMPGVTGFEVCRMLRQIPRWQDLPIIFLTGQTGVEARLEAFRSGGDDYLPKPVVNEELLTRVSVRLDRARMLKDRSDKDTTTGLLLRRAFSEQLSAILAEAHRLKTTFTICLLDVDHFKKVNDTYGHLAGDKVLAGLGQLLSRRFRVDDLRGRWGGEEFMLTFKRETKATMHAAVQRVLLEFQAMTFSGDKGETFQSSFSGGIAEYPVDGESVFELVKVADNRLYLAKHRGRKQLVVDDEPCPAPESEAEVAPEPEPQPAKDLPPGVTTDRRSSK
ncbi:MAG: response regulator [Cyanobacteria bacterium SZAS TMP-1]|nr:response regulator [Cyanobacteria bacterium SZAS TMP-1]